MSNKMLFRGTWIVLAAFIVGVIVYGLTTNDTPRDFDAKACFEWATTYMLPWVIVAQLALILIRLRK
jgi:hypothetical protein